MSLVDIGEQLIRMDEIRRCCIEAEIQSDLCEKCGKRESEVEPQHCPACAAIRVNAVLRVLGLRLAA